MKRNLLPLCVTMMLAVSCGTNSSYTENPILGTLPSLTGQFNADQEQAKEKHKAEIEKLAADGSLEKIVKLGAQFEADQKEKETEFETQYAAELAKIVGREVPVSYSSELQNSADLFYEISDAKIIDLNGYAAIAMKIKAKNDMIIERFDGLDRKVYFRVISTDQKPIATGLFMPIGPQTTSLNFAASQVIQEQATYSITTGEKAPDYVNFAGVEFITPAQYQAAQK